MVKQGVVIKNVASLYRESSNESERVTQAILGQITEIEKEHDDWRYIKTWDGYHGWIEARWFREILRGEVSYASTGQVAVVHSLIADIFESTEASSRIITKAVVSTELEVLRNQSQFIAVQLPAGEKSALAFIKSSDVKLTDKSAVSLELPPTGEEIVSEARRFIGVPYLWGGTTPFGLDCSGFAQLVFHINGVDLPRDARMQAEDPKSHPVSKNDLPPGDLLFFAHEDRVTHVGISLGGDDFIHSAGEIGVSIATLKEEKYKKIFWGAKRIFI